MTSSVLTVAPNRHLSLSTLTDQLRRQKEQSFDVIASADTLRCVDGGLVIPRTVPTPTPDGVDMGTGFYGLNDIALAGISAKLDIPLPYLRRMAGLREPADANLRLLDANVNGWLERDDRRFLVRLLRNQPSSDHGTVRALLSDRYLRLNHLDVLIAALDGIRQAGVGVQVASCDLTDRRMYVRFVSPEIHVMAPQLLRNYRSPFDGRRGSDLPIISAGFLLTNSETGYGRYTLAPYLRVEVCQNGQTIDHAKIGRTHVGARITDTDGIITASERTIARWLDLIREQTTDAVRAYLDVNFLTRAVHDLERAAGIAVPKPQDTIKIVAQQLRYTQQQQDDILAHFIQGADPTAGGVMQAVTSLARSTSDADTAFQLESSATRALRVAAAAA
ncbi:hypothetical protein [Paractinoplanes globisporus]|uniref:DUF932 domain-containing protein n=1 Tax=Paractinoplanes globisporus TaxID=113565 RepID=A0ABW6WGS1_9ACTN|nr:hypothetical protein [Actinoplanes globisporus]